MLRNFVKFLTRMCRTALFRLEKFIARSPLTGSRIRERRSVLGLKQADLARSVGISPSYLNLIEHNRRRIGGKLLLDLARVLSVEISALTEGAEMALLSALREAASGPIAAKVEADLIEDFAGRFPGWAGLVQAQHQHIARLERTIETLTDRLTHDPFLSASLHEVLSAVTAIRSTASILTETKDLETEWREKFHKNIHEDSVRLAESTQALVTYLDAAGDAETTLSSPQEELEAWLENRGYHMPEIEADEDARPLILAAKELTTRQSRAVARAYLKRYSEDCSAMPLAAFQAALEALGPDPAGLAARFNTNLSAAMRRIAALPDAEGQQRIGLVVCDSSGTLTFRKPLADFPLPRFGAACPLWPLYQALMRPMAALRQPVEIAGRNPRRFLTYAVSEPAYTADFNAPQMFEATMLIVAESRVQIDAALALPVGTSCRICPRKRCAARREPTILSEAF